MQWYSEGGQCEATSVAVCSGRPGEKHLDMQAISTTLPAPNAYPVRVFVNLTYSFSGLCPILSRECDDYFELVVGTYYDEDRILYSSDGVMPDHRIQDTIVSGTQQFFFNLTQVKFTLRLRVREKGVCVTVSRVLVYRYECAEQIVGLEHRPATQAAANGNVPITPQCEADSTLSGSGSLLLCTPEGTWESGDSHCVCNQGYSNEEDGTTCKGMNTAYI